MRIEKQHLESEIVEVDLRMVKFEEPSWTGSNSEALRELYIDRITGIKEIQRRCASDRAIGSDDFLELRKSTDASERTLGEAYYLLYERPYLSSTPAPEDIVLEWKDDHYQVLGDVRLLSVARKMDVRHLPARVFAPQATLNRLRLDGLRLAATELPRRGLREIEREHGATRSDLVRNRQR